MLAALRGVWRGRYDDVLRRQADASDRAGLIVAATKFVRMLLQTLVLGAGAYLAIHREISAGSMIAASIIIGRTLAPIESVVANWKGFVAARCPARWPGWGGRGPTSRSDAGRLVAVPAGQGRRVCDKTGARGLRGGATWRMAGARSAGRRGVAAVKPAPSLSERPA